MRLPALSLLLAPTMVLGQDYGDPNIFTGFCAQDPLAALVQPAIEPVDDDDPPLEFSATQGQSSPDGALLEGDVVAVRGEQRLTASQVQLDREANRVSAEGGVEYGDPRIAVRSDKASLDLDAESGEFEGADYYIPERNAQGSAQRVAISKRDGVARMESVTYSTCTRGEEFWQLRSSRIDLDQESGRGSARNITLAMGGVPVMYFPYLSFPITDERQSGFLTPTLGQDETSGFEVRIPYYWNIAPNMDATFAPRILSKRGLQLGVEYRLLLANQEAEIDAEYLPNDRVANRDRYALNIRHQSNFAPGLNTDLVYQYVSDDDYIDDLDNFVDLLSPSALERHLDVFYQGSSWYGLARVQDFQTIDPEIFADNNEPYNRLPQLLFRGDWGNGPMGLRYEFLGEVVNFDNNDRVSGMRLDLQPTLSLPMERPEGFLKPRLSYRYTTYQLRNTEEGQKNSPTRGLPIVSVDSGLFFERTVDWSWLGSGLQTLEPRLFYLYVPDRDQQNIPLFDSTEVDRSYAWLFLENRFTGGDRVGDANQLTAALTTRLIQTDQGQERLRASIGQIFYFEDQEVTLENIRPDTDKSSVLIGEAFWRLSEKLDLRGTAQWDPRPSDLQRTAVDLRYRHDPGRLVNVSYRLSDVDELEQLDISMLWSLGDRWRTMGRWNYSLESQRNLDLFAGVEYQDCCWALRMLARQRRSDPEADAENAVYLELELKGLAGVGQNIDGLLEDTILGYRPFDD